MDKIAESLAPKTKEVGTIFYKKLKNQKFDLVCDMFSKRLYKTYSKENLNFMFEDIRNKCGFVKEEELINVKVTISINDGKKQHLISNVYEVLYSSGFVSKEQLTFVVDDKTKMIDKIDGYSFEEYKK